MTKSYQKQRRNLLLFIFLHQLFGLALAGANLLIFVVSNLLFQTFNIRALILDLCIDAISDVTSYCDIEAFGLIVFVLGSVFCFWYCFYWLLSMSGLTRNSPHL